MGIGALQIFGIKVTKQKGKRDMHGEKNNSIDVNVFVKKSYLFDKMRVSKDFSIILKTH